MRKTIQVLKWSSKRMSKGTGVDVTRQCAVMRVSALRFSKKDKTKVSSR